MRLTQHNRKVHNEKERIQAQTSPNTSVLDQTGLNLDQSGINVVAMDQDQTSLDKSNPNKISLDKSNQDKMSLDKSNQDQTSLDKSNLVQTGSNDGDSDEDFRFECDQCWFASTTERGLSEHLQSKHEEPNIFSSNIGTSMDHLQSKHEEPNIFNSNIGTSIDHLQSKHEEPNIFSSNIGTSRDKTNTCEEEKSSKPEDSESVNLFQIQDKNGADKQTKHSEIENGFNEFISSTPVTPGDQQTAQTSNTTGNATDNTTVTPMVTPTDDAIVSPTINTTVKTAVNATVTSTANTIDNTTINPTDNTTVTPMLTPTDDTTVSLTINTTLTPTVNTTANTIATLLQEITSANDDYADFMSINKQGKSNQDVDKTNSKSDSSESQKNSALVVKQSLIETANVIPIESKSSDVDQSSLTMDQSILTPMSTAVIFVESTSPEPMDESNLTPMTESVNPIEVSNVNLSSELMDESNSTLPSNVTEAMAKDQSISNPVSQSTALIESILSEVMDKSNSNPVNERAVLVGTDNGNQSSEKMDPSNSTQVNPSNVLVESSTSSEVMDQSISNPVNPSTVFVDQCPTLIVTEKSVVTTQDETSNEGTKVVVVVTKDVISKDVVIKDVVSKDVVIKDVVSKDIVSKDVVSADNVPKEVVTKDVIKMKEPSLEKTKSSNEKVGSNNTSQKESEIVISKDVSTMKESSVEIRGHPNKSLIEEVAENKTESKSLEDITSTIEKLSQQIKIALLPFQTNFKDPNHPEGLSNLDATDNNSQLLTEAGKQTEKNQQTSVETVKTVQLLTETAAMKATAKTVKHTSMESTHQQSKLESNSKLIENCHSPKTQIQFKGTDVEKKTGSTSIKNGNKFSLKCSLCKETFSNENEMENHLGPQGHFAPGKSVICEECPFMATSKDELLDHGKSHYDGFKLFEYHCKKCSFKSMGVERIRMHLTSSTRCL
jgi:hypothetical protein